MSNQVFYFNTVVSIQYLKWGPTLITSSNFEGKIPPIDLNRSKNFVDHVIAYIFKKKKGQFPGSCDDHSSRFLEYVYTLLYGKYELQTVLVVSEPFFNNKKKKK